MATYSLPSNAAQEKSVASLAQFGEMGRVEAPHHVEYGFNDFGFDHPYVELQRYGRLVVQ